MRRCALCLVDYPDALTFCPTDGAKLPPVRGDSKALHDPLIGSTIDGRYLIDAVIGEGGMGLVYSARHAIIDKRVAVKVLRKEAAADESSAHRFLAEAKAASKIGQLNIVDITDFGVLSDGHAYFVMEFLDGVTLGKTVTTSGPMTPAAVVSFAIQVARGLSAAHAKGIIHRDLKPENIFLLERDGLSDFVKIVDFGIARDSSSTKRLTVAGMVMGTPEYMAPEQASGQETDHRVDQYALACIMYESLTGSVPFSGENAMQTLTKHVFEAVRPPSVRRPDLRIPPALEAVIMKSLQKDRDDRYADMDAMMRAMQGIEAELREPLAGVSVGGRPAPLAASAWPTDGTFSVPINEERPGAPGESRSRMPLFVGAGVVLLAAGIFAATRGGPPEQGRERRDTPIVESRPVGTPAASPEIALSLRSTPTGADVYLANVRLGATPITIKHARGGGALHLVFKHAGFEDVSRDLPSTEDATVVVTLAHGGAVVETPPAHPTAGTTPSPGRKALPKLPDSYTLPVRNAPGAPVDTKPDPEPETNAGTSAGTNAGTKAETKPASKPPKENDLRNPFGE